MLIPCYKLKHSLDLVEPAVARKATLPITQNFLIQNGRVMATNLDMAIAADLPEAKGATLCLPHGVVSRFIQYVPNTDILDIAVDGIKVTIRAGRMVTTIHGADPEEFPPFPRITTPDGEWSVDGDRLVHALMGAVLAVAREDSRPVLTGVCLTFGDPIEVAGADGFRLIWNEAPIKLEPPEGGTEYICIPRASVLALEKTWKKAVKPPATEAGPSSEGFSGLAAKPSLEAARMAIARRMARVRYSAEVSLLSLTLGEATLTTQLLMGDFPNYHTLIPEDQSRQVTFDAAEAYRAVRMLSGMAEDGSGIIRMNWEADAIEFSAGADDLGNIAQTMPATIHGEPGRIAYNSRYLLEYLASKEGLILMETSTVSSPGRFTHARSPNLVLMPMFVQWGDEPEEEAPESEGEVERAVDESPPVESDGEPVVDPEVDTATTDSASEPASDEADIPATTRPRAHRGHKPAK